MDLGASLCSRSKPQCDKCPLQTNCYARINHMTDKIPAAKVRARSLELDVHLYIYECDGKLWLEKRADTGIWAGLYCFPEHKRLQSLPETESLPRRRHILTHRVLTLHPYLVHLNSEAAHALEDTEQAHQGGWFGEDEIAQVGLPQPIVNLVKYVLKLNK